MSKSNSSGKWRVTICYPKKIQLCCQKVTYTLFRFSNLPPPKKRIGNQLDFCGKIANQFYLITETWSSLECYHWNESLKSIHHLNLNTKEK